jgi:hypothetical protein
VGIQTSSDTYVFHVTLEAEGDLPDNANVEYLVSHALFHWFNVLNYRNPFGVIGVKCDHSYTDKELEDAMPLNTKNEYILWRTDKGPRPDWVCKGNCGVRAFVITTLDWQDIPKDRWECLNNDEAWPNPYYGDERASWSSEDNSVKMLRSRGDCHDSYQARDALKATANKMDHILFVDHTGSEYA